jgi:hypothetical protein
VVAFGRRLTNAYIEVSRIFDKRAIRATRIVARRVLSASRQQPAGGKRRDRERRKGDGHEGSAAEHDGLSTQGQDQQKTATSGDDGVTRTKLVEHSIKDGLTST